MLIRTQAGDYVPSEKVRNYDIFENCVVALWGQIAMACEVHRVGEELGTYPTRDTAQSALDALAVALTHGAHLSQHGYFDMDGSVFVQTAQMTVETRC